MASGWALIQGRALIRGNTAVNTYGIKVPVRVHAIGVKGITRNLKTSHYSNILSTVLKIVHTTRRSNQKVGDSHYLVTSNNQRSAGDNDRRSKHFCSSAVLCVGFTWQIVKTRVISLRGIEGRNTHDQIVFCAFHSFLVKIQANAGNINATHE